MESSMLVWPDCMMSVVMLLDYCVILDSYVYMIVCVRTGSTNVGCDAT